MMWKFKISLKIIAIQIRWVNKINESLQYILLHPTVKKNNLYPNKDLMLLFKKDFYIINVGNLMIPLDKIYFLLLLLHWVMIPLDKIYFWIIRLIKLEKTLDEMFFYNILHWKSYSRWQKYPLWPGKKTTINGLQSKILFGLLTMTYLENCSHQFRLGKHGGCIYKFDRYELQLLEEKFDSFFRK